MTADRLSPQREAEIAAHLAATTNWSIGNLAARDLLAELTAVRAERDEARAYEQRLREQHDLDVAELNRLRARVRELERPAVERLRGEIQLSYRQLAAQSREDGDYEGEATVLQRLADREAQWKREDEEVTR